MADQDFWQGMGLVTRALVDAARKASYAVGCGAGGLGFALWGVSALGISGPAAILIPMAGFFLLARLGRLLDERAERREPIDQLRAFMAMQEMISARQLDVSQRQHEDFKQLAAVQEEYIRIQHRKALQELIDKETKEHRETIDRWRKDNPELNS